MLRLFKRLSILLIFIITGCTANYDITINKPSDIIESLDVTESNSELFDKYYEQLYNSSLRDYLQTNLKWPFAVYNDAVVNPIEPKKINGVIYYDKRDISNDNTLGMNISYNFNENFNKSNILNTCYDFEYNVIKNVITFKTTSNFKCFESYPLLNKVVFNLHTKCNVISDNSDLKKNDIYTWNIDNSNKSISFSLNCGKSNNVSTVIILPIYFVIIFVGIVVLKMCYKINNRF